MYHRSIDGLWWVPAVLSGTFGLRIGRTEENAGGRPSRGRYESNPRIELILPKAATLMCVSISFDGSELLVGESDADRRAGLGRTILPACLCPST